MIDGFIFNGPEVLHLLLVVGGILACFVAAGALVVGMTRLVERNCRRDIWFDEDGKKNG